MDNSFQGRPAPTLRWYGDKWNNQGSYDSKNNTGGFYFLMLPQPLCLEHFKRKEWFKKSYYGSFNWNSRRV